MTMRLRTGYSFRSAIGRLEDIQVHLKKMELSFAPITDTASTFGYVKWNKLCAKNGLKPIFGLELAVTNSLHEKKPTVDYWTFIARESLKPIHELIGEATRQFRYQPMLTREQALARDDVFTIMGHRAAFSEITPRRGLYAGLGPSLAPGQLRRALEAGHTMVPVSDNRYIRQGQQGLYETICGRGASTQSYPQWIMTPEEWTEDTENRFGAPVWDLNPQNGMLDIIQGSTAKLTPGEMIHPDRPVSLYTMCCEGALRLGCDLDRPEYSARLSRELQLIQEKDFEDYFYLVADICQWARERMIVGPARGSSCGSLVCYLLRITSVDPIPYGLIFERFIDINRSDLPDIDIDFPEHRRSEVFEYVAQKYGRDKVARLGTVAMYQPRSAMKEAAGALDIPPWILNPVMDAIIERSSGDSRALQATEDTMKDTVAGRELLAKYPEIIVAAEMEGHPRHAGQHAAGIVITERPTINYVAVDQRTGATMCDKKDAEDLNLLKIDALGLTQLSIFEDALELAGLPRDHLFSIPMDDQKAFDVLNNKKYAGIFQFNGVALQSITDQVKVEHLNDIVSITALARPGPLNTGGTNNWIKIKNGLKQEIYPHPSFEPYMNDTLGVITYQEQILNIGRWIGDLSWEDVTALRKAMSRSLGKEFFDQYGEKWKVGARKKGIPESVLESVWNDLCAYGSWCLSGSTKLKNPHPNQYCPRKEFSLVELFRSGGLAPGKKQQGGRRQKLFAWDGKGLKPFANLAVTCSGKQQTFELRTKSGKKIYATAKHQFLTVSNKWVALGNLALGESVMVEGEPQLTSRKSKKGTGSGRHNWQGNKEFYNGKLGNRELAVERDDYQCQCCGLDAQEVHHVNGDHEDHRLSNLLSVCRKCHKKIHREMGTLPLPYQKGKNIIPDEIISIKPHKVEMTYDVSMPPPHHNFMANGIVVHNCFNKSHALAYGIVSYWCCWLKGHYPLEFAAATLSHTDKPETQIKLLRELASEGIEYLPADIDYSTDKWTVKKGGNWNHLVGPLSNVVGCGPKMQTSIIDARNRGEPIPERAAKLLANPKTKIDSLYPVKDAIKRLMPDPKAHNIISTPRPLVEVQTNGEEYEVLTMCKIEDIKPKDENEALNVAKRGGKVLTGPTASLNLRLADDTDTIFARVNRWDFDRIGKQIVERGRAGKALYAVKGSVPRSFRMISVRNIKYIGDMDG